MEFLDEVLSENTDPTLAFTSPPENENSSNGLHIMNSPTKDLIETFSFRSKWLLSNNNFLGKRFKRTKSSRYACCLVQ